LKERGFVAGGAVAPAHAESGVLQVVTPGVTLQALRGEGQECNILQRTTVARSSVRAPVGDGRISDGRRHGGVITQMANGGLDLLYIKLGRARMQTLILGDFDGCKPNISSF
jgi:hypothetical protein